MQPRREFKLEKMVTIDITPEIARTFTDDMLEFLARIADEAQQLGLPVNQRAVEVVEAEIARRELEGKS